MHSLLCKHLANRTCEDMATAPSGWLEHQGLVLDPLERIWGGGLGSVCFAWLAQMEPSVNHPIAANKIATFELFLWACMMRGG